MRARALEGVVEEGGGGPRGMSSGRVNRYKGSGKQVTGVTKVLRCWFT
jgi:hypothetical protein